jgi:hypothetical protein
VADDVSDEGDDVTVVWARARLSRIGEMAPPSEQVLTLVCGSRVVAAVWPKWSTERFVVTELETTRLDDSQRRRLLAGCRCRRRQHVLDLDKVATAVREMHRPANKRAPNVPVLRVAPDRPGSTV